MNAPPVLNDAAAGGGPPLPPPISPPANGANAIGMNRSGGSDDGAPLNVAAVNHRALLRAIGRPVRVAGLLTVAMGACGGLIDLLETEAPGGTNTGNRVHSRGHTSGMAKGTTTTTTTASHEGCASSWESFEACVAEGEARLMLLLLQQQQRQQQQQEGVQKEAAVETPQVAVDPSARPRNGGAPLSAAMDGGAVATIASMSSTATAFASEAKLQAQVVGPCCGGPMGSAHTPPSEGIVSLRGEAATSEQPQQRHEVRRQLVMIAEMGKQKKALKRAAVVIEAVDDRSSSEPTAANSSGRRRRQHSPQGKEGAAANVIKSGEEKKGNSDTATSTTTKDTEGDGDGNNIAHLPNWEPLSLLVEWLCSQLSLRIMDMPLAAVAVVQNRRDKHKHADSVAEGVGGSHVRSSSAINTEEKEGAQQPSSASHHPRRPSDLSSHPPVAAAADDQAALPLLMMMMGGTASTSICVCEPDDTASDEPTAVEAAAAIGVANSLLFATSASSSPMDRFIVTLEQYNDSLLAETEEGSGGDCGGRKEDSSRGAASASSAPVADDAGIAATSRPLSSQSTRAHSPLPTADFAALGSSSNTPASSCAPLRRGDLMEVDDILLSAHKAPLSLYEPDWDFGGMMAADADGDVLASFIRQRPERDEGGGRGTEAQAAAPPGVEVGTQPPSPPSSAAVSGSTPNVIRNDNKVVDGTHRRRNSSRSTCYCSNTSGETADHEAATEGAGGEEGAGGAPAAAVTTIGGSSSASPQPSSPSSSAEARRIIYEYLKKKRAETPSSRIDHGRLIHILYGALHTMAALLLFVSVKIVGIAWRVRDECVKGYAVLEPTHGEMVHRGFEELKGVRRWALNMLVRQIRWAVGVIVPLVRWCGFVVLSYVCSLPSGGLVVAHRQRPRHHHQHLRQQQQRQQGGAWCTTNFVGAVGSLLGSAFCFAAHILALPLMPVLLPLGMVLVRLERIRRIVADYHHHHTGDYYDYDEMYNRGDDGAVNALASEDGHYARLTAAPRNNSATLSSASPPSSVKRGGVVQGSRPLGIIGQSVSTPATTLPALIAVAVVGTATAPPPITSSSSSLSHPKSLSQLADSAVNNAGSDDDDVDENHFCRICQLTHPRRGLISPCSCAGTSRFVHRKCLRRWRDATTNPEHKQRCSECRAVYVLPPPILRTRGGRGLVAGQTVRGEGEDGVPAPASLLSSASLIFQRLRISVGIGGRHGTAGDHDDDDEDEEDTSPLTVASLKQLFAEQRQYDGFALSLFFIGCFFLPRFLSLKATQTAAFVRKIMAVFFIFFLLGFVVKFVAFAINPTSPNRIDWFCQQHLFYHMFVGSLAFMSILMVFCSGIGFIIDFPKTLLLRLPFLIVLGVGGPIILGFAAQHWLEILLEEYRGGGSEYAFGPADDGIRSGTGDSSASASYYFSHRNFSELFLRGGSTHNSRSGGSRSAYSHHYAYQDGPEVSFGCGVFIFVAFVNNMLPKLVEMLSPDEYTADDGDEAGEENDNRYTTAAVDGDNGGRFGGTFTLHYTTASASNSVPAARGEVAPLPATSVSTSSNTHLHQQRHRYHYMHQERLAQRERERQAQQHAQRPSEFGAHVVAAEEQSPSGASSPMEGLVSIFPAAAGATIGEAQISSPPQEANSGSTTALLRISTTTTRRPLPLLHTNTDRRLHSSMDHAKGGGHSSSTSSSACLRAAVALLGVGGGAASRSPSAETPAES